MTLSILIVNWNTRELLAACLESIFRNAPLFAFEVIVVDNASSDGSAMMLKERYLGNERVKLIESRENLGFAKANNLAFSKSTGEYILLLNPDTEVQKNSLVALVDYLTAHPETSIVGPRLINPDGSLQPSVRRFPDFFSSILVFSGLHRLVRPKKYFMDGFDYSREAEVDQVMGAALATRRSLIEKLGLFDEKFWLWYEEVDFCKRVKGAGQKVVYYPDAVIRHRGAESFSQLGVFSRKKIAGRSLIHYFRKHSGILGGLLMGLAVGAVLAPAFLVSVFQKTFRIKSKPYGV